MDDPRHIHNLYELRQFIRSDKCTIDMMAKIVEFLNMAVYYDATEDLVKYDDRDLPLYALEYLKANTPVRGFLISKS